MESIALLFNFLKSLWNCFSPRYLIFQASEIYCKSYRLFVIHLPAPLSYELLNFVEVSTKNLTGCRLVDAVEMFNQF